MVCIGLLCVGASIMTALQQWPLRPTAAMFNSFKSLIIIEVQEGDDGQQRKQQARQDDMLNSVDLPLVASEGKSPSCYEGPNGGAS